MKVKGLRWYIIGMIAIATVINYIDRFAIGVMWPAISTDLNLTKDDYVLITTFFTIAYAIGQSSFGKIFDVLGTRMGFVLAIIIWSISIAAHAVVKGVASLCLLRFTLGFGEAGNWPGAAKSNAIWFPLKERAFAQGIFNAGAAVGGIASPIIVAALYAFIGWKATFIALGALGVVWVIPWLILYKSDPDSHPWLGDKEREYIIKGYKTTEAESGNQVQGSLSWKELLSYRQSWAVILSRFFLDPIWWLFFAWLPIYLADVWGFDVKGIGLYAWVPYVGAAIGSFAGGIVAGFLIHKNWSVNKARLTTITLGGVFMMLAFGLILGTNMASTPLMAVLLIAVILFGFQFSIGNIQTLPGDYFSGASVGSLAGISGTAAVLGFSIWNFTVPILTQESYTAFFILAASLVPLALISVWVLGRQPDEPVENRKVAMESN